MTSLTITLNLNNVDLLSLSNEILKALHDKLTDRAQVMHSGSDVLEYNGRYSHYVSFGDDCFCLSGFETMSNHYIYVIFYIDNNSIYLKICADCAGKRFFKGLNFKDFSQKSLKIINDITEKYRWNSGSNELLLEDLWFSNSLDYLEDLKIQHAVRMAWKEETAEE